MRVYYPKDHYFNDRDAVIMVRDGEATRELGFAGGKAYHSPDGFAWGYHGSGPAELARAILFDVLRKMPDASLYQEFKVAFIAKLPQKSVDWSIDEDTIRAWLTKRGYSFRASNDEVAR